MAAVIKSTANLNRIMFERRTANGQPQLTSQLTSGLSDKLTDSITERFIMLIDSLLGNN